MLKISSLFIFLPSCLQFTPIITPIPLDPISQEEFAKLDYRVMHHAYQCQNQLGRLCDEVIYQNDLAARLQSIGLGPVRTGVRITVTHRDFTKHYSLDLMVADAGIYELKTAHKLVGEHDAQLLNYLFLYGSFRGKLINFRPPKVESRFVNTTLAPQQRHEFEVDTRRWQEREESDHLFRTTLLGLLEDWGSWLELALYTEAITHFIGGPGRGLQLVPLQREGISLGNQHLHLLSPETAFRLTALPEVPEEYEYQLRSLLGLSPLRTMQWVNFAHHCVEFITLRR